MLSRKPSLTPLAMLLVVLFTAALGGCASTAFYPHEARDNVHVGKGGSRFTVQGIDVWFNGEPARKYAILGYIDDRRPLYADDAHKTIDSGVLEKAVEIGADGLIETIVTSASSGPSSGIILHGGSRGMGVGFGFGFPVSERATAKYTAVKYLD